MKEPIGERMKGRMDEEKWIKASRMKGRIYERMKGIVDAWMEEGSEERKDE